jgi:hypothetical protein
LLPSGRTKNGLPRQAASGSVIAIAGRSRGRA